MASGGGHGGPAAGLHGGRQWRVALGGLPRQLFPHTTGGEPREDRTRILRATVHNRAFILFGFSPQVSLVHEVRTTNAQLYDYKRTGGELRLRTPVLTP